MLRTINKWRNFGVTAEHSELLNGKIRLTNGVGMSLSLVAIGLLPVWAVYIKSPYLLVSILLLFLTSSLIPLFNKNGSYRLSVFLLGYCLPLIAFAGPMLSKIFWVENRVIAHYFAPQIALLSFFPIILVVHEKRNWNFYFNLFLVVALIFLVDWLHSYFGFGLATTTISMQGFPIFLACIGMTIVATFSVFELSNRMTFEYQQKFLQANKQLKEKVLLQDQEITRHEHFLRDFHAIITTEGDFDNKINKILKLGSNYLGLHLGILSRIQDGNYVIRNVFDANHTLTPGISFELGNTVCHIVLTSKNLENPTILHPIGQSSFSDHPAYQFTKVETYIGVPIVLQGEVYGTLNFSSTAIRESSFSPQEIEKVKLMGQTINYELAQLKSRRELIKSQRLFANIAQVSPVGIYRTDLEGNCIYVNEKWCAIAGLTKEQAQGAGWVEAIHPEDRKLVFEHWNQSVKQNRRFQLEYRFYNNHNKETTWLYGEAVATYDDQENIVGYVGTITDLSEIKRTEEELKKLSLIAKETDNAVIIADPSGRVEWVNQGFTKISGYTFADMQGELAGEVLRGPNTSVATMNKVKRAIQQGVPVNAEVLYYRKDGTPYWVEINLQPLFNSKGEIHNFIAIERDITKSKNADNNLLRIKELERTRISRELHDSVGQMLIAIRILINNLKREQPSEALEEINHLVSEAIRETRLIVYELSTTLLENHSVKQAILKLLDNFKKISDIPIQLSWEGSEEITDYKIAHGLFRIVQEAVQNAIKYSNAEQVSIDISNISEIKATIKDDGIGFDRTELPKGSGFGLNNIQERAALLDGWAEVKSSKGVGTEVEVRLP